MSAATLTRPNGKVYRPRKVVAVAWENPNEWRDDTQLCGVIILGTHDLERAQPFADRMCMYWYGLPSAILPRVGWFRDGFEYGERTWVDDEVHGRAGVMFSAAEVSS